MTTMTTGPSQADWDRADLWGSPRQTRGIGPVDAVWALVWFIVVQVVVTAFALAAITSDPLADPTLVTDSSVVLIAGLVSLWAVFGGFPLFVSWRHGTHSLARDFGLVPPWAARALRHLVIGFAAGLALRAMSIGASLLAGHLGLPAGENSSWLTSSRALGATVFLMIGAAVIGPIFEEIFFRGFLMRTITDWATPGWLAKIRRRPPASALPSWWPRARGVIAIVTSSVLFGFMHITGADAAGAFVVTTTGTVGLVLAIMTARSGTLSMAIGAHVAFNSSGIALMLLGVAG